MDCTSTLVAAPGLRPTASEAFAPIRPTPRAAPSAANPTWRFPVNSASMCMDDIESYLSFANELLLPRQVRRLCPLRRLARRPAPRQLRRLVPREVGT